MESQLEAILYFSEHFFNLNFVSQNIHTSASVELITEIKLYHNFRLSKTVQCHNRGCYTLASQVKRYQTRQQLETHNNTLKFQKIYKKHNFFSQIIRDARALNDDVILQIFVRVKPTMPKIILLVWVKFALSCSRGYFKI